MALKNEMFQFNVFKKVMWYNHKLEVVLTFSSLHQNACVNILIIVFFQNF